MSKVFYAVNRTTGERWKRTQDYVEREYLVMYDSGCLAAVTENGHGDCNVSPLDPKEWDCVVGRTLIRKCSSGEKNRQGKRATILVVDEVSVIPLDLVITNLAVFDKNNL